MRRLVLLAVVAALSTPAFADDFDLDGSDIRQADFRSAAEDVAALLSYKALNPAEATGITGFGIGAFASYVSVDDENAWARLTGDDQSGIGLAGVAVHKGLPLDLDLGAYYAVVPGTDARIVGGELRWALLPGSIALPAIALRGGYTQLSGIDDVDADAFSADVSISKGFALFTPYAGVGYVWSDFDPRDGILALDTLQPLQNEKVEEARLFAGLRLALGLFEITPEFERLGDRSAYNLRLGLSF